MHSLPISERHVLDSNYRIVRHDYSLKQTFSLECQIEIYISHLHIHQMLAKELL